MLIAGVNNDLNGDDIMEDVRLTGWQCSLKPCLGSARRLTASTTAQIPVKACEPYGKMKHRVGNRTCSHAHRG